MKSRKKRNDFGDGNRKKIWIYGAAAVSAAVLAIVLAVVLFRAFWQEENVETGGMPEAAVLSKDEILSHIEQETAADPVEEEEASSVENIPIAAEVAEMNDEEDPQENGNKSQDNPIGAEVDVTSLDSADNNYEVSGITFGVDVAKYQGTIDWEQVKAAGAEFAMIRVGYRTQKTGIIYEDPCAKYNMQQAQAAGIKLGVYFFSTAVNEQEAKEEAAWVTDFIAQYKITYPVVYNCEGFLSEDSRQFSLDKDTRTNNAAAFLDYVKAKGYMPMFYAAKNELENNAHWNTDALSSKYKIWVSHYPSNPYPQTASTNYSGEYVMWQHTNQGQVPGIPKKVDLNIAYFGYTQEAEAKDDTPPETVEADPEVGIVFTEVNEEITAKIETNLRTVPSTASPETVVTKLVNGEIATRTGIGNNGWSRVMYNGQKLYAVSSYLTVAGTQAVETPESAKEAPEASESAKTQTPAEQGGAGVTFQDVDEQVTAKIETNLRSVPSTESDDTIVGKLMNGETLQRTGVADNGWSRLNYNGQNVYAVTSYLIVAQ